VILLPVVAACHTITVVLHSTSTDKVGAHSPRILSTICMTVMYHLQIFPIQFWIDFEFKEYNQEHIRTDWFPMVPAQESKESLCLMYLQKHKVTAENMIVVAQGLVLLDILFIYVWSKPSASECFGVLSTMCFILISHVLVP
jgi:hypothetical protein